MTNPNRAKILRAILILAAVVSLAATLILVGRLYRTGAGIENLRQANERAPHEIVQLEKQRKIQVSSQGEKREPLVEQVPKSPPAELPDPNKHYSKAPAGGTPHLEQGPDEDRRLNREEIQKMLTWTIDKEFPELNLSEADLWEMSGAVITINESMHRLRHLDRTAENAQGIKQIYQACARKDHQC